MAQSRIVPASEMPPATSQRGMFVWWASDARKRLDSATRVLADHFGLPLVDRSARSQAEGAILAGDLEASAAVAESLVEVVRRLDALEAELVVRGEQS